MNLKSERTLRGLTQKELAAQAGLSVGVIADIERGTVEGARSTWARLEAFFNAPPTPERTEPAAPTHDAEQGESFAWYREQEGLTQAALAKLMGCQKREVEALEAGELRLLPAAWDALERFKDKRTVGVLGGGLCGFCGREHAFGECHRVMVP